MKKLAQFFILMLWIVQMPAHAWKPEIGEMPGSLQQKLEYVDGSPLELSALRGKPVVLYFGGDWCPPCVSSGRPATASVAKKYGPMGLQVVFASLDDNRFRPLKLQEAKGLAMSIVMPKIDICPPGTCLGSSQLGDLGDFGRVYVFPTAIVLDADGIVRAKMDRGAGVRGGLENAVIKVMDSAGLLGNR
jgi:thiol-disulfide isomerase/thioredoxin